MVNAAISMGVQISLWDTNFISLWYVLRSWLAGSYGSSIFNFWELSILFSIMSIPIYFPVINVQEFILSISSQHTTVILNVSVHQNFLEDFEKHRFLGFWFSKSELGLKNCVSNKFSGNAHVACSRITLSDPLPNTIEISIFFFFWVSKTWIQLAHTPF